MVSLACSGQKTDKVFLKNGDILTGEIKNMKFAKLSYDITGPGLIQIKWEEVIKIRSDKRFRVTTKRGIVLITSLDSVFFETNLYSLDDIIEIVRIKDKFLQRLDGKVDLGFNYAKSNDNLQFNFGSSITYRESKNETNLQLNSVISHSSKDTLASKKQDAVLEFLRKLKNSYYIASNIGWQANTQLGLNNRFSFRGGGGKIFISDNHRRLLTGTGLSFNLEQSNQSTEYKTNLEALVVIQYKQFRYSSPKVSIDAGYTIFPNLSEWGRLRMDIQLNAKVEIFKDFNVGISFYDLYDNRPPAGAASKNDFGINFTIGYEFGK